MSIGQCATSDGGPTREVAIPASDVKPLQRLARVRRLQGLSRRTVARRMNLEIEQVRQQEQAAADLTLSTLYAWQKALEVPVAELLVEADGALASPVLERSQLVRLMKTVLAIRQRSRQESIRRMAETMIEQLVEIMPELAEVGPWHAVGRRRRRNELGIAAQRRLSDDVFVDRDK
ncbi:MAG: helix-turn-helix transcriptional regulator [Pirellulales bacterium]|nr:helix-turn-helix transcriptional regulator [Pirellulales bacterium]